MQFKPDEHETAVLFRKDGNEIVAVFPTIPADSVGRYMTCYAQLGQHGSCSFQWYWRTKPAKPHEYEELKNELESAPFGYRLKVYQKITPKLRDEFNKEAERIRRM